VEDVDDDDTSDSDASSGQGEFPGTDSQFHSLVSKEEDSGRIAERLKEDFWSLVGFPAGSRWWEEGSSSSAVLGTKNLVSGETDLEPTKIIVEPANQDAVLPKHHAPKGISATGSCNRRLRRTGVPIRPWRRPLPRPRPATISVLGDFLPIQFQPDLETRLTEIPPGKQSSILGHEELILRAKSYGRPKPNLESHRENRTTETVRFIRLIVKSHTTADSRYLLLTHPRQTDLHRHGSEATTDWGTTTTTGHCDWRDRRSAATTRRPCGRRTCGGSPVQGHGDWGIKLS
jgi:hypothetical protein